MTQNKQFVDIEIGADIGQIRLYLDEETYETFGSDELLGLINNLVDENKHLENTINRIIKVAKKDGVVGYHQLKELQI